MAGLPTSINCVIAPFLTAVESAATAPGVTVSSALVSPYPGVHRIQREDEQSRGNIRTFALDYNLNKHHSLEFDYHYAHFFAGPDLLNNRDAEFPVAPFNTSIGAQVSNRNLFVIAERWTIGSNMSNEIRFGIAVGSGQFRTRHQQQFLPDDQHELRRKSFRSPLRFPASALCSSRSAQFKAGILRSANCMTRSVGQRDRINGPSALTQLTSKITTSSVTTQPLDWASTRTTILLPAYSVQRTCRTCRRRTWQTRKVYTVPSSDALLRSTQTCS